MPSFTAANSYHLFFKVLMSVLLWPMHEIVRCDTPLQTCSIHSNYGNHSSSNKSLCKIISWNNVVPHALCPFITWHRIQLLST